jgi:hypothetical protein
VSEASSWVRPTQSFTHATIFANSQTIVIVLCKIFKGHKLFGMGLMGKQHSVSSERTLMMTAYGIVVLVVLSVFFEGAAFNFISSS